MTAHDPAARTAPLRDPAACAETLADLLLESLRALAKAGQAEAACRLAGRACVALRIAEPRLARRFDVLLHRLAPMLDEGPPTDRP